MTRWKKKSSASLTIIDDTIDDSKLNFIDGAESLSVAGAISYHTIVTNQVAKITRAFNENHLDNIKNTVNTLELILFPYLKKNSGYKNKTITLKQKYGFKKDEESIKSYFRVKFSLLLEALSDKGMLPAQSVADQM